jgi:drug/metabolite transporter (DMT)-like permease
VSLKNLHSSGIAAALMAAVLFGMGTPLAKALLGGVSPWLLAGLLYLGSGIGLFLYRKIKCSPKVQLPKYEVKWFAGAVLFGGVLAPVLLMWGLTHLPAANASLLLNAEAVFTALLAWFVFKEQFDARIFMGMVFIVLGAVLLSGSKEVGLAHLLPSLAVLGACLAWGLDNNLTRKVSLTDATWLAMSKGAVAGVVNLILAFALGAQIPAVVSILWAMVVGFLAYGLSLVLFVVALRHLGAARTGAYFSIAPFVGALLALLMGEPLTWQLGIATLLMAVGIVLHLTEHHAHPHEHSAMIHEHEHTHDTHHQHEHEAPVDAGVKHTHLHVHSALRHTHAHFPDMHHLHEH